MKELFPAFNPLSKDEVNQLWDNKSTAFVVDVNFLLNLYSFDSRNAEAILNLLKKQPVKNRLWLPYHVARAYNELKNEYINQQINNIKGAIKDLNNLTDKIDSNRAHPYLPDSSCSSFHKMRDKLLNLLQQDRHLLVGTLEQNSIDIDIDKLFPEDCIDQKCYDHAQVQELCKRAELRYNRKKAPGYLSTLGAEDTLKYHQYIVWKEMQRYAGKEHKNILMIRGYASSDWFNISDDRVIGPNPNIVDEFYSDTKRDYGQPHTFYCMDGLGFIEICKEKELIHDDVYLQLQSQLKSPIQELTPNSNNIVQPNNNITNIEGNQVKKEAKKSNNQKSTLLYDTTNTTDTTT